MNDTSPEMDRLWRSKIMARSPEERFIMGLSMYGTARAFALSSLKDIDDPIERKVRLFRRFYAPDFSEKEMDSIDEWFRKGSK